jgi:type III secretion protein J
MKFVVVALLAILLAACSRHVELMASIAEPEANEVIAALQNAGIAADKTPGKEGMVGISIEAAQVGRAMDLLRSKGLPRERHAGMGQVFKKEGLISSPLEERARYIYALSQELDATLSQIDGVVVARVHVVLPERGAIGDPVLPSSAAVFIKYQDGYNLDALQPQIRRLVNNSIPGLAPEKISIVLFSSQAPAAPRPAAAPPASNMPLNAVLAACALAVLALAGWFGWNYVQSRRADALLPSEG